MREAPDENVPAVVGVCRDLHLGRETVIDIDTARAEFFDEEPAVWVFVCEAA